MCVYSDWATLYTEKTSSSPLEIRKGERSCAIQGDGAEAMTILTVEQSQMGSTRVAGLRRNLRGGLQN